MKWIYLVVWGLLAWRELPPIWKAKDWQGVALWLAIAGAGLALAVWYFWGNPQWRMAEWILKIRQGMG